jgi:hypothetical protein
MSSGLGFNMRTLWPDGASMGDQDPHSWGRFFWAVLHAVADRLARRPELRADTMALMWTLRDVLPCTSCRKCFRHNMQNNPPGPDTDLAEWLTTLETSIEQRQRMQPGPFVVSVVPRSVRPPVACGEDELALVVGFALKGAAGRNLSELERWSRSFQDFLRELVVILDPQADSILRVFATYAGQLRSIRFDLYEYLSRCVAEHSRMVQGRRREARATRAAQKQAARGAVGDPNAAILAAKGIHGIRRPGQQMSIRTVQPMQPVQPQQPARSIQPARSRRSRRPSGQRLEGRIVA